MNLSEGHDWKKDMGGQCRRFVRLANKNGMEFRTGKSNDEVSVFFKLYSDTMIRTEAESKYMFSHKFIDSLSRIKGAQLLQCCHGERMVSGVIGLEYSGISTYFLAGSDLSNGVGMNNKLIFDMANYYKERGCRALNLGGGISSRPGLIEFKRTFSKKELQFNILKHIYDSEKYNKYAYGNGGNLRDANFFPAYRDQ